MLHFGGGEAAVVDGEEVKGSEETLPSVALIAQIERITMAPACGFPGCPPLPA